MTLNLRRGAASPLNPWPAALSRRSDVTIIAFDVASRESWEEARRLLVRHGHPTWSSHRDCVPTPSGETARRAPPPLPAILVATKVDRIAVSTARFRPVHAS